MIAKKFRKHWWNGTLFVLILACWYFILLHDIKQGYLQAVDLVIVTGIFLIIRKLDRWETKIHELAAKMRSVEGNTKDESGDPVRGEGDMDDL